MAGLSLDHIAAWLLHPLLSLACIAGCLAVKGELWTQRAPAFAIDGLLVLCIVAVLNVGVRCGSWASQRWRNGTLRTQCLTPAQWAEQVVVVTGGGSGVGLAAVELLLAKGARVVSLGIHDPDAAQGRQWSFQCDVSSRADVDRAAERIRQEVGHPTMLLNNAGVNHPNLILDLSDGDIDSMFDTNVKAHFYTIQAFLPHMLARGSGHIVCTASALSYVGASLMTDYCASKHALLGLMEALRYELDKKYKAPRVRTTVVTPGHIRTPLFADVKTSALAAFLSPTLEPQAVAQAMVDALERQESSHIAMPFYAHSAPLLKTLPSFLRDLAQWIANADDTVSACTKAR